MTYQPVHHVNSALFRLARAHVCEKVCMPPHGKRTVFLVRYNKLSKGDESDDGMEATRSRGGHPGQTQITSESSNRQVIVSFKRWV